MSILGHAAYCCKDQIVCRQSTRESTSLIPQTLDEMATDLEYQDIQRSIKSRGQTALTREEKRQRQRSLEALDASSFYTLCQV